MKTTFLKLGNNDIAYAGLARDFGLEPIPTPPLSEKTLALGAKYAPEFACLPFKVILGSHLEAWEAGARALFYVEGRHLCRYADFSRGARAIFENHGRDLKVLSAFGDPGYKNIVRTFKQYRPDLNWLKALTAYRLFFNKLYALKSLQNRLYALRPRAKDQTEIDKLETRGVRLIDQARNPVQVNQACQKIAATTKKIPLAQDKRILKIGLVGDIYMINDPFINFDLEKRVGIAGGEISKFQHLADIIMAGGYLPFFHDRIWSYLARNSFAYHRRMAKPYLSKFIGSYCDVAVGEAVDYGRQNFDGLIQIFSLGCMPETTAQGIFKKISRDYNIPLLTLIRDEHTAPGAFQTRLEAFMDMLRHHN